MISVYILLSDLRNKYLYATALLIIIWLTDLLDGFVARKQNKISELGKIIDPLADKFAVILIALVLIWQNIIPLWFALVIIIRDIIILTGGLYLKKKKSIVLQSNFTGKLSVFIIGLTIVIILFTAGVQDSYILSSQTSFILELVVKIFLIMGILVSVLSIIIYSNRFFKTIN